MVWGFPVALWRDSSTRTRKLHVGGLARFRVRREYESPFHFQGDDPAEPMAGELHGDEDLAREPWKLTLTKDRQEHLPLCDDHIPRFSPRQRTCRGERRLPQAPQFRRQHGIRF